MLNLIIKKYKNHPIYNLLQEYCLYLLVIRHFMNTNSKENLRDFLLSLDPELIKAKNEEIIKDQIEEFEKFSLQLEKGICYLCGQRMDELDETKPCFHWFTYPKGIKKKNFEKYLKSETNFGFFNIDAYFRWLANSEKALGNINDLNSEISEKSFLETTYKYKNIQWAFSIGDTDLEGHQNSHNGNFPHYHIEMKVNDNIFIKFNDFHIPFSDEDIFKIELEKQASDLIIKDNLFGSGMSFLENEKNIDLIEEMTETTDDYENATLNYQSFIIAEEGKTITSEMLMQAIEESKKTKKPVGLILNRMTNNPQNKIIISPGDGVPKMSKRSGKK